jgi:hypothetical protein
MLRAKLAKWCFGHKFGHVDFGKYIIHTPSFHWPIATLLKIIITLSLPRKSLCETEKNKNYYYYFNKYWTLFLPWMTPSTGITRILCCLKEAFSSSGTFAWTELWYPSWPHPCWLLSMFGRAHGNKREQGGKHMRTIRIWRENNENLKKASQNKLQELRCSSHAEW